MARSYGSSQSMNSYLIKRLSQAIISIWAVLTITFVLIRLMPGNPIDFMAAQLVRDNPQAVDELAAAEILQESIHIDQNQPLYMQYVDYMSSMMTGDLGHSIWYDDPVIEILADAVPWTIFVMTLAILATFLSGIFFGGFMAYKEGGKFDVSMTFLNIFSSSVPYYVFALLLLGTLGYQYELFPLGGRVDESIPPGFNREFMTSALMHGALPFLSLVLAGFGGPALAMRGNAIQVLGSNYLRVARLRGLSQTRIATRYVTRNAVLPLYTQFMIGIAAFFGGSVILEQIFAYPGVGYYTVRGFEARDYPLMMGCFILLSVVTIVGVLIADLTYSLIDPRVQTGDENESF